MRTGVNSKHAGEGRDNDSKDASNNAKSEQEVDEMKKNFEEKGWKVLPSKPRGKRASDEKKKEGHQLRIFQTIEPEAFNAI